MQSPSYFTSSPKSMNTKYLSSNSLRTPQICVFLWVSRIWINHQSQRGIVNECDNLKHFCSCLWLNYWEWDWPACSSQPCRTIIQHYLKKRNLIRYEKYKCMCSLYLGWYWVYHLNVWLSVEGRRCTISHGKCVLLLFVFVFVWYLYHDLKA